MRGRVLAGGLLWGMLSVAAAQYRPDVGTPFFELAPPEPPGLLATAPPDLERAFAGGEYDRAQVLARAALVAARARFDPGNPRLVDPLVNLATVQQHAGEHGAAIVNYRQALDLLHATGNARDPRQARPLRGLGDALYATGRYQEAAQTLQRAAFVVRVNQGLQSLDQLQVYPALTQCYIALGQYDEAVKRQQARLAIVAAATGKNSPELAAAQADAADWFRRMGRYLDQRRLDERRMDALRDRYGGDDPRLVPVLRDLAGTYASAYEPQLIGVRYLQDALDIQADDPEATPAERARTLVALGDYYLTFGARGPAAKYYLQARDALAGEAELRKTMLERPQPVFLTHHAMDGVGDPPLAALPAATAALRLTVGSDGRVRDFKLLSVDPQQAGKMRSHIRRMLRDARFRPRITADGPVRTTGVRYDYRFRYRPQQAADGQ